MQIALQTNPVAPAPGPARRGGTAGAAKGAEGGERAAAGDADPARRLAARAWVTRGLEEMAMNFESWPSSDVSQRVHS